MTADLSPPDHPSAEPGSSEAPVAPVASSNGASPPSQPTQMAEALRQEQLRKREDQRLRRMSFWNHLEELRGRLLKIVIGVVVTTAIGMAFASRVLEVVIAPMGEGRPVALHPTESIVVYFRLAFMVGLALSMPFILYQLLAFITPGLTKSERKIVLYSVFGIGFFFILGMVTAAMVMLPVALTYLQGFLDGLVRPTYSLEGYVSFVTTVMLSTGLVFETPLLLALLARIGLVTSKQLAKGRRFALVGIAALAALITPTPDAFNMLLTMAPLLLLYELGIVLAWLAGRARDRALAADGM